MFALWKRSHSKDKDNCHTAYLPDSGHDHYTTQCSEADHESLDKCTEHKIVHCKRNSHKTSTAQACHHSISWYPPAYTSTAAGQVGEDTSHMSQCESVCAFVFPHLLLVHGDPVCCCKPLVSLDVLHAILEVSIPLGEVHLKEVAKDVFQVRSEVGRKADLHAHRDTYVIHFTYNRDSTHRGRM